MWISEIPSLSTTIPTGVEEDVAKTIEVDIEVGVTVDGKIIQVEVDRMTSRPIEIMGDEE